MVQLNFNAATVAPNVAPEPVPTGIYDVMINKSEEKPAKSTPGATYVDLSMVILDGEFKGKVIHERLNLKNPNAQAVEIANSTLSSICHVTGVMQVQESAQLHNVPFKVNVVKIPRNDDPSKESNEIRGYMDKNGNPPNASGGGAAADPAQAAAFGADTTETGAPKGVAAPAPEAPPAPPAAPAAEPAFPPEGWTAHPTAPGYFYKGSEVLLEADLRAKFAAPAAPPAAPPAPDATAAPAADAAGVPDWAQ